MKYILFSLIINFNCLLISMNMDHNVCKKLEKAHQKNNLSKYKKCIVQLLPFELCKHIDTTYALVRTKKIRETYSKHNYSNTPYTLRNPTLTISNDGHFFAHNVAFAAYDHRIRLINTALLETHNPEIHNFHSDYNEPVYFFPNNTYCITKELRGTYFYDNITGEKYCLHGKEESCGNIITSSDNQYVLIETSKGRVKSHTLWSLHEQGIVHSVALPDHYFDSDNIFLFHPNNKQLIRAISSTLCAYDLEEPFNIKEIASQDDKNNHTLTHQLTFSSDNKKIIARTTVIPHEKESYKTGYIVFDIEDLENITSITIPPYSCHSYSHVPMVYIPNHKIFTRVINKGCTLELLDEQAQLLTSHTPKSNAYITQLVVDTTGNYLAAGYSDCTIMIWYLFDLKHYPDEKIFIKNNGTIKKLTFSDNQLLLSQSQSDNFWDTQEPTSTPGSAVLWDVYGNEIINFGNNIVNSIMSKNGKTIVIVSAKVEPTNNYLSPWQRFLMLTAYHNKNQTDNHTPESHPTLSQLYMMTKNKKI